MADIFNIQKALLHSVV